MLQKTSVSERTVWTRSETSPSLKDLKGISPIKIAIELCMPGTLPLLQAMCFLTVLFILQHHVVPFPSHTAAIPDLFSQDFSLSFRRGDQMATSHRPLTSSTVL